MRRLKLGKQTPVADLPTDFVESGVPNKCACCCLNYASPQCMKAPCFPWNRADKKNGYFVKGSKDHGKNKVR